MPRLVHESEKERVRRGEVEGGGERGEGGVGWPNKNSATR